MPRVAVFLVTSLVRVDAASSNAYGLWWTHECVSAIKVRRQRTSYQNSGLHVAHHAYRHLMAWDHFSLIPKPPPRFYLAAVAAMCTLHSCEIKSGRRPGNEATTF